MKEILAAALFCSALVFASGTPRASDGPTAAGSVSVAPDLDAPVATDSPASDVPATAAAPGKSQTPPSAEVDLPPGADYPLEIAGAYAFATAPTQKNGAAFMALQNTGKVDAVLTGAWSPVAEKVELHTMAMENGVMQMRPVDQFVIPAGGTLVMAPQSHHLMLIGLKSPLKTGDSFSIKLSFSNYPPMDATFKISAPGQAMEMDHHDMGNMEKMDHMDHMEHMEHMEHMHHMDGGMMNPETAPAQK